MPLYKLREEMPYDEFIGWSEYFSKRPVGWREDSRTSMIMRSFGVKAAPSEIFPSLKMMKDAEEQAPDRLGETLKKSVFFQKMLKSTGGDKIGDLLK